MKYAILSDIHGNAAAFKAALADARANGAEGYCLLGDYTTNFPWGNEVVEIIRGLENATVIRGNGEGYLLDLLENGWEGQACEQFKLVGLAYRSLSKENLAYLAALPETAAFSEHGETVHLAHMMDLFMKKENKLNFFRAEKLRAVIEKQDVPRDRYLRMARAEVLACSAAVAEIRALPEGVYLFGHNHLQFYMKYEDRLFVNPGSCGEALDGEPTAAYTLLENADGRWIVTERRVKYDLDKVAEGFHTSGYAAYSPEWSKVIVLELTTGKSYFSPFVQHLVETGRKLGRNAYPVSDQTFRAAVETWEPERYNEK